MNKKIIRKFDWIKIIDPKIFVRCGYPLSIKDFEDKISDDEIINVLKMFQPEMIGDAKYHREFSRLGRQIDKIKKEIAYVKLKHARFGGKERRVYTEIDESLRNKFFLVENVRYVNSGDYVPSVHHYDDYKPAILCNRKTHKILDLSYRYCGLNKDHQWSMYEASPKYMVTSLRIEAIHVIKEKPPISIIQQLGIWYE